MGEELTWVKCKDPSDGMFWEICQKWGKPPAGSRGAWITRGITDWNHATESLKKHAASQWHRDASATAVMAKQSESGKSVLEIRCSSAEEHKQRNRDVLLKLLRSTYFLPRIESLTQQFIRIYLIYKLQMVTPS